MKLPRLLSFAVLLLACASQSQAATLFSEGFADNSQGWTLGVEWQIGSTFQGAAPSFGFPDPDTDHSPTSDNGVAGAILGGNVTTFLHAPYVLTSPVVNTASATSPVTLSFWRWLNSDSPPFIVDKVEVFDGTAWVEIWTNSGDVTDNAWTLQSFDVSAYKNASFQVRFSHSVNSSGAFVTSGWNIDDVRITSAGCPEDLDGDGFQSIACGGGDCDDTDPAVHPGAAEICDGKDNDCNGVVDDSPVDATTWFQDADGDGFGNPAISQLACTAPVGYVADSGDCDDTKPSVNPNGFEYCDGIDNDCDGLVDEDGGATFYRDQDGDGWGTNSDVQFSCTQPVGYVGIGGDCDDGDAAIHPEATEILDGRDNNCDGQTDEGFENPVIRSVRDIPNDQGRAVRVRWRKDLRESGSPTVTSYTLYRKIGPGQALTASMRKTGADIAGLPPGDWDVLTTIPATTQDSVYQTVVGTLCDSTSGGICWSVFVVRAFTGTPGVFFDSAPDSGYSVDNIAPGVPQGLLVTVNTGGKQLSWQPSGASDFQYFRIYRGTSASFTPSPANLVHATETTGWSDATPGAFTYKVTAVDANGNESAPATASSTTGVDDPLPTTLAFGSIAPNPFRGVAALAIDVPQAAGSVSLAIYDLAGRRMRTLVDGPVAAGHHALTWDGRTDAGDRVAPGVYLVRLMGAGRTFTKRVTMMP